MAQLLPEAQAREQIDALLSVAGWTLQDYDRYNPSASRAIALREIPMKGGRCDYLLLLDRQSVGVIEAKKTGTTLSMVAEQSAWYGANLPEFLQAQNTILPFYYESTGVETFFRDERDPSPRSRRVFAFHQPETLAAWLAEPDTLRARLEAMPAAHPLVTLGMRGCQTEAITRLEKSFAENQPRALIQMATGAGKTYTACASIFRLIKYARAKRVLFLVDRANLGRQATSEFQQFVTPDLGRKFTELYNIQHLTSNQLDSVSRVTICTIQRLYSMLRGEELPEDLDEVSGFELAASDGRPREVSYNRAIPIETFDFIVTDECHRSIYNLWRQVPKFFTHYVRGSREVKDYLLAVNHGATRDGINTTQLLSLPVLLAPLKEQRLIVSEIEKQFTRLDAGIAALYRAQTNLKRYRAAVLKAACEGRLVPHEATLARRDARSYETGDQLLNRVLPERRQRWSGRGRYAEASLPEGAELPSIPVGWAWTTLDAIAEIKGGVTKDQKRKPSGARAVPYLRVANVQRGYLDLSEMKEILATKEEIAELALRPGDILFNEGGDRDKLGRGWVWSGQIPVCIHQNHVFRARLYDRALQPQFVSWYANWLGQRFFFDKGKHTTNLASISMSKLRLLPIPVPPPAEQIRIVIEVERCLSVIDALEVALDANVLRASRLRESILHRAFSGRLSRAHTAASTPSTAVSPQRRHFARAVLSAEIVTRLHREPTFGRIKHQKIFHLCEHIARLGEIQGEYHREVAGPLDTLAGKHGEYDVVLANPPFGKKSSVTIVNAAGEQERESLVINRDDFWATTSNKQLNFLQHFFTILKQHGRAAVVLPDNVLFEGGAGETVRRELLKQADVHTLLRLPTGIFYAQGVKANVVFFDRKPAREKPWTETLWIYDLRTNQHFTLKENPLKRSDLDDFVACYNVKNRHERQETERFKPFTYADLTKRDKINLDIFWLKDESLEDSANLPDPHLIALEVTRDLEAALEQFATIAEDLER